MAKQFNPFHHWLGFNEKLTQPNHFQLFGVKPNSDDPIGFRKQIHHRAKAMLAQLEQMSDEEVGERRKLHTRLRRHIVKAHEALLDDKLRAAYLKGLRQKAREQKGSAKPLAVPPPQQAASQTSKGETESLTFKGSGTPTIKQQSIDDGAAAQPAIPMAIPLSKPAVSEASQFNAGSGNEVNFDNLESAPVSIKPGRIKRKKSWLIPIVLAVMTLFCIAGIGALVNSFGNKLGLGADPIPRKADPAAVVETGTDTIPQAEKPPAGPTSEEIRRSTEEMVNSKPAAEELSPDALSTKALEEAVGIANVPDEMTKPEEERSETRAPEESTENVRPSPNAIDLTDPQMHSIRFLFQRARNEMKRGRLESAAKQYDMVESIFEGQKIHLDQISLTKELKNGRGMIRHLEGFFKHVKLSARKITGGDLEPEPGTIIGFVEGRQHDVVLRFGENVAIPYQSLSPGLAMALGAKKGALNVPSWRLDQAAYRIIHTEPTPESNAKTEELIAASEADEYDASAIRGFWTSKTADIFPEATMTAISRQDMKPLTAELRNNKYKNVDRVDPQLAGQFATAFSSVAYKDPTMRIVALNEAIRLAERAGDAGQMLDLVDELNNWTEVDTAKMKSDGFTKMVKKFSRGVDPRPIGDAFYEFLKSPDATKINRPRLNSLRQGMLVFVDGNRLLYLKRLITQTMD